MASTSEIRAGQAVVTIGTRQDAFERGLRMAEKKLHAWGKTVTTIGAGVMGGGLAVLAPLGFFIEKFVSTGTELQRLHEQLGMSVEDLSALKSMAGEAGIELEDLAAAFGKFQANLGTGKGHDILHRLGVSPDQLKGHTTAEQLATIADAIARVTDQSLKAAAARELFGRGGLPMLRLLNQGGEAIRDRLGAGGTFTSEDAKNAEEFHRALTRIQKSISSVAIALGGELVKSLLDYLGPIQRGVTLAADFIKQNKALIVTIGAIALGAVVAGGAIIGLGTMISAVGTIIGGIVSVASFLTTWPALIGLAAAAATAAIVGLTVDWKALGATASTAFGAILQALKAGELQAAFKVATTAMALEWARFVLGATKRWVDFKRGLTDFSSSSDEGGQGKQGGGKPGASAKAEGPPSIFWTDLKAGFVFMMTDALRAMRIMSEAERKHFQDDALRVNKDAWKQSGQRRGLLGAQKDLEEAQKAFDAALAEAAKAAKAAAKAPAAKPKIKLDGSELMSLADMTKGTFSSYAVAQSLSAQSADIQRNIETNTRATAEGVKGVIAAIKDVEGSKFA